MSSPTIWGPLPRNLSDPTQIDAAIGAAVSSHNDDPDAHLGADQALQSHRAADIIDHLAESVVNDKIRSNARTYLAIVDAGGGGDYTTLEEACDYAYTKGSGSIFVKKGTYTPSRDLKLKYGVDIYGEGPNETNIYLGSTKYKCLNVSGSGILTIETVPAVYYTEGDDKMYFDASNGIEPADFDHVYMQLFGQDGLIGYNPGEQYIVAWDAAPYSDSETNVYIESTVNADNTTDIIHVNGWKFCQGIEDGEGLYITTLEGGLGFFKEYLGNGDIRLTTNSERTVEGARGMYYDGPNGRMSVIQGVSFNCGSSNFVFQVDGSKGRLYVRDASFSGCKGIFKTDNIYATEDGGNVTIEDAIFWFGEGACDLNITGATIRNSQLNFNSNSYPLPLGGQQSYFENCTFNGSTGGITNKLQYVLRESRFNGCIFNMMTSGYIVNNGAYGPTYSFAYVSFVACTFSNGTPRECIFNGNNIIVSGCRFQCSTANVGLSSGTKYSTFTGNQGRGTLLAQPTNSIVTANGLWPSMT